mmetsp:Transcript_13743/g.31844  ORF Transcript_13743/g.31844 Transcript_13743/m.31844 type:complete len:4493 (+) Transcript_13743:136-13614(+)|eukprot:CAMPEP_0114552548 /NCGR_PEP_ID=MMETSP0114-20121206/7181_1 /TAXON_ID=31324 /ORGANISM="Goniomonas sp, Strain m" /LENGTH=4492 /DNA_ID=CAMNT_0001737427 /DNA_START=136 /DNA_END=13614 /DNA_ORIENTATION=-
MAAATGDARSKWIISKIQESLGPEHKSEVESVFANSKNQTVIQQFFGADGPPKLIFFFQPRVNEYGEERGEPHLFLTTGDQDKMSGRCFYVIRLSAKGVDPKNCEADMAYGELQGSPLESFQFMLEDVYGPMFQNQEDWGKATEESHKDFLSLMMKFNDTLSEAVHSLQGGIELRKPDKRYDIENKQPAYARAAQDLDIVEYFENIVEDWCQQTEKLLSESEGSRFESDDAGPDTEFEFWRNRMAKFNSVAEQLKSKECKTVLCVLTAAKSKIFKRWKQMDNAITDALNEAKDNVKYLSTLEKYTEPLYNGSPTTIIDSLPALMNNVKMMLTIARYYSTNERMTTLFVKITNQMIKNCRKCITKPGRLWDQDVGDLLQRLESCLKLNDAYQEQYRLTKDKLMTQPKVKQFDFNESQIFGKLDLFCKRVQKLMDMFTTIQQFSMLSNHKIEGMEHLIQNFFNLVEDFKKKPYDLLDYTKNTFDRDFLEYNVNIAELETALQGFINASFENITSTEHALSLLKQFESILQRETLKADLESKYTVIFHNYGLDLETVQKIYDTQKHNPPMIRNAPPVAGNIIWARQLLRRIEEPMKKFKANKNIMTTKESKKIIRTYNKVARALIEFETLWHHAWCKSIDAAKSGLQATLIVRHSRTGKLFVNFDREILQLIRETKCLQRISIDVPESAKMVLLQEDKFKSYYNQLSFALKEYDRVLARVIPVVKPLLKPHLEDLNRKIQPGMLVLTWQSMNIDGYLHRIHTGLVKFEELVNKINDVVENRVESNLKIISKTLLVDMPDDQTFTLEQFVSLQEKVTRKKTQIMDAKNLEVERAVSDLIDLVLSFPLEVQDVVNTEEQVLKLREHYSRVMYLAILQSTKYSLFQLKSRLASRVSGGFQFLDRPFFEVAVELNLPNVTMNPSLEEIQSSINRCAVHVLRCSKKIYQWRPEGIKHTDTALVEQEKDRYKHHDPSRLTFHTLISRDKEIAKVVLFLTGSVEGTKKQVHDYLSTFTKYQFLWKDEKATAYQAFLKTQPDLEAFDLELKKYMQIETTIEDIPAVHNIGCMSLETQPLKTALKSEAGAWKSQYAKNLHQQAKEDLDSVCEYMKETCQKLERKTEGVDLDDVRDFMGVLKDVRDRESEIDNTVLPIEERYQLLQRYDVRVPKEEIDVVGDLRLAWNKVRKLAGSVNDKLNQLQAGFKRGLVTSVKSFVQDTKAFRTDFEGNGPMVPALPPMEAAERLKKFQRLYQERERKWISYSEGEQLFGLPVTHYPELQQTKKELDLLEKLYSLYVAVVQTVGGYSETLWVDVVSGIKEMGDEVNTYQNQCKKLPRALKEWSAYETLKTQIDEFLEVLPLLQQLSNKAMRPRHWEQVMQLCDKRINMDPEACRLADLLGMGLLQHQEEIEEICNASQKELQIESKLVTIGDDWQDTQFAFANFKNRGPVILKGAELSEIMEKLEDSQMSLGSMATNRYSAPFREDVQGWIIKLSTVSDIIEQWTVVQSMWIYMEAVFSSGDIAKQLPAEAKRFQGIDKNYMKIMARAFETPNVVQCCYGNDLMKTLLPHLTEQLEMCQKSLTGYLETKRGLFPRFYFVSDGVLLEVLSQGSDPHSIQVHLQAVFDSIASVTFDRQKKTLMTHMHSSDGETVPLTTPVDAVGNIEDYLTKLVIQMQQSMKDVCRDVSVDCESIGLEDLVKKYPAQVCLLGVQFQWTRDAQDALTKAKTDKLIMGNANKKIAQVLTDLVVMTTKQLSPLERTNVETLITIQVHQRDIFDAIVKNKIKDPADFEWQKQCRFYWRGDLDNCIVSIADVDFEYCYEYLGCKERLCITPLTDRCYITLSQALGIFLGGYPAGPAGTGKTETVKDLGRTLGKFVVVFNCSDQMDFRALGKLYKGLAMSGCWGGFDEFNRIDLEVLSVAAQQVHCIFTAMRERRTTFVFTDGQVVPLDPKAGIFITGNPGYAGRQELPENLKTLFRNVTMMVPDREIIMRVKLASVGYQGNVILSKKFNVLYALCEQQLSKQVHYDFGLRNILSVLRTAGATKRSNLDSPEDLLLMRTLRDMNLSKLVREDEPLFLSLINDMFPGLQAKKAVFPSVEKAIEKIIADSGLQQHMPWVDKVIQLYESYLVRHGLCVVGPSGAGKTCIIEVLAKALTETGIKHSTARMNPKAITAPQMFGKLDVVSNDWTDGIFAVLWRKANKQKTQNSWIVLDGPVDAIWIENLNTVLDDNKLLTLANGDRIPMIPNVKLVFEPEDLNNASPATVSRMGIIYVSASILSWGPPMQSWMDQRRPAEQATLKPLFEKYVEASLAYVDKELKNKMFVMAMSKVTTTMYLLEGMLQRSVETKETYSEERMERVFVLCLLWSIGALLELDDRKKFDSFLRSICDNLPPAGGETAYEYTLDDQGNWEHWKSRVVEWKYPIDSDPQFASLLIPTMDSVRYEFLLCNLMANEHPCLLIGAPGVTKSATAMQYLSKLDPDKVGIKAVPFSYATTTQLFQRTIEGTVEKRQGRTFGPPGGRECTVFVDDISMPLINEWKDQPTNEIVRQVLAEQGIYSLDKPGEWKNFVDLKYLAAMTHPGGGRNDIPNRLKRQFSVFNVTMPSLTAIDDIFGTIVRGRYSKHHFSDSVVKVANRLTEATIALWQKVQARMLPTPAKFHYMFNMRELSRTFQGMLECPREVIRDEIYLLNLWKHECERVFCDKLTNSEDKNWYASTVLDLVGDFFGGKATQKQLEEQQYFVNFLSEPQYDSDGVCIDERPKSYEMASSLDVVRKKADEYQSQYNDEHKVGKLELVLFEYALQHLMRISRIINMDRGSTMLVGVGGSGKQTLTRLASYIAGNFTFQITITKHYNVTNLFDDLRMMYRVAGFQGRDVSFVFTDAEVKEEGFLEYINQMLATGEVSNLFSKDDLDAILNDMRGVAKKEFGNNFVDTNDNLYKYFMDRVRNKMHLVLCFSPVGDKLSSRTRQFPGLINCTTVDWFLPWPEEGLRNVSQRFISDFDMETSDEIKGYLITHMANVHRIVQEATGEYFEKFRRHVYVTPKSYLSFIKNYTQVYRKQHGDVKLLADKINVGLQKLFQAGQDIAKMKVELAEKEQELAEKQKISAAMLVEITNSTAIAEKKKKEVEGVKNAAEAQASKIGREKEEVEEDLAAAKPALLEAETALSAISAKDIQGLKALKNPPVVIRVVFDGVLILKMRNGLIKCTPVEEKGVICYKDSYPEATKMMNEITFLQSLMEYQKEAITDEMVEILEPYMQNELFTVEKARSASSMAAGLCAWVRAMAKYHVIAKVVIPKIDALTVKERELAIAQKKLNGALAELAKAQGELDAMQAKFDKAMAEKQQLQDDLDLTKRRMDSATALITGLAGEKDRWTQQSHDFADQISRLVGDCALACAFMSYCGPFNKTFRDTLLNVYFAKDLVSRKVPLTTSLQITKMLATDADVGEWNIQGLPTDDLSIQNGILVTSASRWPLLVDPQGQGLNWIKNREEQNMLKVTNFNDRAFRNTLEDCLSYGKPMLIENVEEELDPVLDPVLEKAFVRSGKGWKISLADKELDYTETFKFFITTRLPNPHYTPELSARVTVIDFTVTMKGLEDQLLGRVVQKEKPELQEQRRKLLEEVNSYQKKIQELEDDLLFRLSSSSGNLLDDTSLIDVLAVTKKTSKEVSEKLKSANEAEQRIISACEEYRPVATRGSVLYFLIAEMSAVNCMYQTSLSQFIVLFEQAMQNAERAAIPSKRISNIIELLTYSTFCYICRGYFERHKEIFVLMLAMKVLLTAGKLSQDHFNALIKGGDALDINAVRKKPKEWIPDASWLHCVNLANTLQTFKDLPDSLARNETMWKQWYDQESPEQSKVPDLEDKLDIFHRLLIVRSMRTDRTMLCAKDFVVDVLGTPYIESTPLNLEATLAETNERIPLVCILSPGADPSDMILHLGKKKKKEVKAVSMGQGQEIIARKLISTGVTTGSWVLLQNTHLGLKFLIELEQTLLSLTELDPEFRIWITSEPNANFPIGLLQMSLKITNEAPVGIKAGMRRSYAWVNQDLVDAVPRVEWRSLLYTMCFCHSIAQERRKFGPIGWSIPYEFNQSDLAASVQFLQNHMLEMDAKKAKEVTWSTVRYMIAEIQYGGRISDDWDRRLMTTYAEKYFSPAIFEPNHAFFTGYVIPAGSDISVFRNVIDQLKHTDNPELFGLHTNADLVYRLQNAQDSFDTILETQPKTGGGGSGGLTREDIVNAQAGELLQKMPPNINMDDAKQAINKMGGTNPINIAFRQELDRLQKVLELTRNTLRDLQLAIAGTIVLAAALIDAMNALFDARVPGSWSEISWQAPTLGVWFPGLLGRYEQWDKWLRNGRPKSFWLTGFFNPQGLLTAMRQEVARKHQGWALDDVTILTRVEKMEVDDLKDSPQEGIYVHGLFLDGCSWDKRGNKLVDSPPKILYTPLPVLYITAVLKSQSKTDHSSYVCPCYRNKARTAANFIFPVNIRTEEPPAKWTLRGVCLLCSKD